MKTFSNLKAATIVVSDGELVYATVKSEKDIQAISKSGGILFEDWETASKVAFCLSIESGCITSPVSITAHKKISLFVPDRESIPQWATVVSFPEALANLTSHIE